MGYFIKKKIYFRNYGRNLSRLRLYAAGVYTERLLKLNQDYKIIS